MPIVIHFARGVLLASSVSVDQLRRTLVAHDRAAIDNPDLAGSFLRPLIQELDAHCVGSLSEIFEGDPPHTPRGCIAQAWTVAEVLRVWRDTVLTPSQP